MSDDKSSLPDNGTGMQAAVVPGANLEDIPKTAVPHPAFPFLGPGPMAFDGPWSLDAAMDIPLDPMTAWDGGLSGTISLSLGHFGSWGTTGASFAGDLAGGAPFGAGLKAVSPMVGGSFGIGPSPGERFNQDQMPGENATNARYVSEQPTALATDGRVAPHGWEALQIVVPMSAAPASPTPGPGARAAPSISVAAGPELFLIPGDGLFSSQWHLLNTGQGGGLSGIDINVTGVWDDYTGAGVDVGVVDDGVAISVLARGSVFIRKWVAPIRALIVPKECSTVSRRWRIFSGWL